MTWQPMFGYFDKDLDLTRPELYQSALPSSNAPTSLPPFAYHSKIFADLEDEKVWTRAWVCIGYHARIPNAGDLLPFTAGNHGIHVQRQPDGSLKGHFNFAQHGGCRFVPTQCQTGKKTSCFYTSCGHSRDRDVILAPLDGSESPEAYMYVGVNPLKLMPIHVQTLGLLMSAWFRRAAEQGDPHAQFNLAVFCIKGRGVQQSIDDALTWYRQAAEQGHAPSQARLGYLYSGNEGVQKDRVQAYLWLSLAANHGAGHALNALESVIAAMSSEEKQEGAQLLAKFHSERIVREMKARLPAASES